MSTFHDPAKKTSINSLLNPTDPSAGYHPHTHHPVSNGHHIQPHGHHSLNYESAYASGSSFHLRAASWDANGGNGVRRAYAPEDQRRQFRPDVVSSSSSVVVNGYGARASRPPVDHAPISLRIETIQSQQAWQPPPRQALPASSTSYHSLDPHTGTMPPDNRHAYADQNATSYRSSEPAVSAYQHSERASVRLAVRDMISAAPQHTGYSPQPQPHYGSMGHHYGPSTYGQMATNHSQSHQGVDQAGPSSQIQPQHPLEQERTSSKRQLDENERNSEAPDPKRPATDQSKSGSDGVPAPSRRGYNARRRNEAAQAAAQQAHVGPMVAFSNRPGEQGAQRIPDSLIGPTVALTPELQFARCMSNRYKNDVFPRCVSCTRRWAGDTCRFQGIRYLLKEHNHKVVGVGFGEKAVPPVLEFPDKWNIPLRMDHIIRCRIVIANALLPLLKQEQDHLKWPQLIHRARETEVRVTCDTCMTSIFSCSWLCRMCGRELCGDCMAQVKQYTYDRSNFTHADVTARKLARERFSSLNPFFLTCSKRTEHEYLYFSPTTRFQAHELEEVVGQMEKFLIEQGPPPLGPSVDGWMDEGSSDPMPIAPPDAVAPESLQEGRSWREVYLMNQTKASYLPAHLAPNGSATPQYVPENLNRAAAIVPTMEAYRYTDEEVTNVEAAIKFAKIWAYGEPVIVPNILRKFKLDWSPSYFIRVFGDREVLITECELDTNKRVPIREFFSSFGKYKDREEEVWKLKDWPPASDFKTAFPGLYEDFSNAVPVPDYVRRDGALNIGSHFAVNVVGPDLGPKMYNAYAAKQGPGSKGSTRLHMDMADAMNIMLYAEDCPDGSPGCAVWDIYSPRDSEKIRALIKSNVVLMQPNTDPIHVQHYYLDDEMRRKLYQQYGVKSYRIYQRPGEAVFIPACCAHQVSNMADCIKIAIDFVSPESVERCARLTREFRDQNKHKVWKEDVLQLKSMLWFGWLNFNKLESTIAGSRR